MRTFNYLQDKGIIFNKRGIGYFVSDDGLQKTRENVFSRLSRAVVGKSKVDDEVLDELEDTFGVTATPGSDIDMEKAISGKLSTRNLATLYNALEVMLGVEITNTSEGIKINKKG